MDHKMLSCEVVVARQHQYKVITLSIPEGTTIQSAIKLSKIAEVFSDLPWEQLGGPALAVGVYGEKKALTDAINDGDRIEIVTPLKQSALEARKARVLEKKAKEKR